MKKFILASLLGLAMLVTSCGENKNTDVVESGTYQGTLEEVDASEKEIYVKTANDKLIELYFTDDTELMMAGGETVKFDKLKKNGKVKVTVEKKGNKNVPITVMMMK